MSALETVSAKMFNIFIFSMEIISVILKKISGLAFMPMFVSEEAVVEL